jgi:Bromodomain
MVVSKSKFSSETGGEKLDMDDPLFWQKVMPDFVTPSIMVQKLDELTTEILGAPKKKGPGRGRWREKRAQEAKDAAAKKAIDGGTDVDETKGEQNDDTMKPEENSQENVEAQNDSAVAADLEASHKEGDDDEHEEAEDMDDDDGDSDTNDPKKKFQLTRTGVRKVAKFLADLKSMMASVLEEAEDNTLPAIEKTTCQQLMLQISINEKLFNEQQRQYAKLMMKRLEGDRRRRCRTSEQPRFTPGRNRGGDDDLTENVIREELRIVSSKKARRKRRTKAEMEADRAAAELLKKRKRTSDDEVDEDGYLRHSDSEGDWDEIIDGGHRKNVISHKEAKRRRQWAADDDSATAAGRPWPVFPRHVVTKVLRTMLTEVMAHDESKGGVFSVPVPKDEFPEYYEQIKKPMDYGTMKEKLENGEYRSAQAMQKDFILVMQNCLQFNSANSDIVKDARQQALMRPSLLRKASAKHHLFLAEDGTVLEVEDDENDNDIEPKGPEKKKRRKGEPVEEEPPKDDKVPKKVRYSWVPPCHTVLRNSISHYAFQSYQKKVKKKASQESHDDADGRQQIESKKKPRIKISLGSSKSKGEVGNGKDAKKRRSRMRAGASEGTSDDSDMSLPVPKRKRKKRKTENSGSSKAIAPTKGDVDEDSQDDESMNAFMAAKSAQTKPADDDSDVESDQDVKVEKGKGDIFKDVRFWQKEREKLEKKNFMAARALFTKYGPWDLPDLDTERKFRLVAKATILKMDR